MDIESILNRRDLLDLIDVGWVARRRYDSVASQAQIDPRTDQLRDTWRLGTDPTPSLCELLEDEGIKVIEDDLPESINGLACQVLRGGKPVVRPSSSPIDSMSSAYASRLPTSSCTGSSAPPATRSST